MQIKLKITISFIAISLLLLCFSFLMIYLSFRDHLVAEFYRSLKSKALMTVAMVEKNNPTLEFDDGTDETDSSTILDSDNIIVYNSKYKKLFALHNEQAINTDILVRITLNEVYKFKIGDFDALGIKYTTNKGNHLIIIAKGKFMSGELERLRNIMILTFLICLIIVAISGYYFARQALKPITNTINELDAILPHDFSKRVTTGNNKDEISRLALSFNSLLGRIEEAFLVQKGFLSNISHELRNPMASIVSTIEVMLSRKRSAVEYEECLTSVLHDVKGLEHTSNSLMQLARLTSGTDYIVFGTVRVDEVVWQAKSLVKKLNPEYQFLLDADRFPDTPESFEIIANEALLKTAFINLFENACKFSRDNKARIKMYISDDKEVVIEIRDSAPLIDIKELEHVFKPFYRSPVTEKIKGSGIGLSLVASIFKVHNARLTVSTFGQQGNVFTVYLKQQIAPAINRQN